VALLGRLDDGAVKVDRPWDASEEVRGRTEGSGSEESTWESGMCEFDFDWNSMTGEDDVLLNESPCLKPRMLAAPLLSSGNALFGLLVETECTEANDCLRGMEMVGC
jgi:hypothetical protein